MFFLNSNNIATESFMNSNGKIYVVIVCGLVILFGLAAYLIYLDKKYKS